MHNLKITTGLNVLKNVQCILIQRQGDVLFMAILKYH